MFGRILAIVLVVAVLVAGAAGIGLTAYRFGFAQGVAPEGNVTIVAPPGAEGSVAPYLHREAHGEAPKPSESGSRSA